MYYEVERLLSEGKQVVITGLNGTGKSTICSKLYSRYNVFRSTYYCTIHISPILYKSYQLFDRINWVDRFVYQLPDDSSLELSSRLYVENLPESYLVLLLYPKFQNLRTEDRQFSEEQNKKTALRYLKIARSIYDTGKLGGLIISYKEGFISSEFVPKDLFLRNLNEVENYFKR